MRTRILFVLALVAGALMAPVASAHAQCAPSLTTEENLQAAETAFVGTVIDRSNRDRTAVFAVFEVWKGRRLSERVTVNGGPEDPNQLTSIDRTFLLGQTYLVLPANNREPFRDSLCTGTQLWSTPTGTIPTYLQNAVGGDVPILTYAGPGPSGLPEGSNIDGESGGIDPLVIAMGVVLLALILVRVGKARGKAKSEQAGDGSSPRVMGSKRRRRIGPRFAMPRFFETKRSSRLAQVRKGAGRFRKGPGEHERQQLERAVNRTATHPPKRSNHYTSGRRSAP